MLKPPAKTGTDPLFSISANLGVRYDALIRGFSESGQDLSRCGPGNILLLLLSRRADVPRHDRPENDGKKQNKTKKKRILGQWWVPPAALL